MQFKPLYEKLIVPFAQERKLYKLEYLVFGVPSFRPEWQDIIEIFNYLIEQKDKLMYLLIPWIK